MKPSSLLRGLAATLAAPLLCLGCASAGSTDTDADSEGEAASSDDAFGSAGASARCGPLHAYDVVEDREAPTQEFSLTLAPRSAVMFSLSAAAGAFTVAVTTPAGATKTYTSGPNVKWPLVTNGGREDKAFRVRIDRAPRTRGFFTLTCDPLVEAPTPSGLVDDGVCRAGEACKITTSTGTKDSVCSDVIFPDLGDDPPGGHCFLP